MTFFHCSFSWITSHLQNVLYKPRFWVALPGNQTWLENLHRCSLIFPSMPMASGNFPPNLHEKISEFASIFPSPMIFPMIFQPSSPVLGLEDPAAESLGRAALWCRADGRKRGPWGRRWQFQGISKGFEYDRLCIYTIIYIYIYICTVYNIIIYIVIPPFNPGIFGGG